MRQQTHLTVFLTVHKILRHKKALSIKYLRLVYGGERGIRTLGTLRYTHFPAIPLRYHLKMLEAF